MDNVTVLHVAEPINYSDMTDEQLEYLAFTDREAWHELQDREQQREVAQ